jgi:predicted metal-binding protein
MKQAFAITLIQCGGCNQAFQLCHIVDTVDQIQEAAEAIHKASKVICADPRLMILYLSVLISEKTLEAAKAPLIATVNGGGGH